MAAGIKISVLANCQSGPIGARMQAASLGVEWCKVPPVHTIAPGDRAKCLDEMSKVDVILSQPLGTGFGELSAQNLRTTFSNKTVVFFPSIYFAGIIPQLQYLRLPEGGTLKGPLGDYHDSRLISGFLANKNPEQVETWLDDYGFDTVAHFETCVKESQKREEQADIQVMDVILDRVSTHQTMYTFNHPDNVVLNAAVERILKHLNREVDGVPTAPVKPMLDNVVSAVPDSVLRDLGYQYRSPTYFCSGQEMAWQKLAHDFFEIYANRADFQSLVEMNRDRAA